MISNNPSLHVFPIVSLGRIWLRLRWIFFNNHFLSNVLLLLYCQDKLTTGTKKAKDKYILWITNLFLAALFLPFQTSPHCGVSGMSLLGPNSYAYLLHIMCGYQCDKAMTKNDTREVIWYQFTAVKWYHITSRLELSNQIKCNNLVGPIRLHVIF